MLLRTVRWQNLLRPCLAFLAALRLIFSLHNLLLEQVIKRIKLIRVKLEDHDLIAVRSFYLEHFLVSGTTWWILRCVC